MRLTIDKIKSIVTPIAKKYHVKAIYLYGSYARGDATSRSNINLRVERGDLNGIAFFSFADEIEEAMKKDCDIISTQSLSQEFLEMIKKDEVIIYESE